jgi:ankyrin repeat protein
MRWLWERLKMKIPTSKHIGIMLLVLLLAVGILLVFRHAKQQYRNTALIDSIRLNDIAAVNSWLYQGADPNTHYIPMTADELTLSEEQGMWPLPPKPTSTHCWTQWLFAHWCGQPKSNYSSVSALIVALDVELDCPSDVRLPPRNRALIQALITSGADVNARDRNGNTPLLLALFAHRKDLVSDILACHADVFARNDYGNTSLMGAAEMGDAVLVKNLIDRGVDINAKNNYGFTALMSAFYRRQGVDYQTVKTLIEHGADIDAKDKDGDSALILAEKYRTEATSLLTRTSIR